MTARSPQLYLSFIIGSRDKLGIFSFSSPFNDLRKYIGSDGCRVRMWRGIRLWASPRYSLRIDESRTQTHVSYGSNETGCRFYCLTDRYYIAIFMPLNQLCGGEDEGERHKARKRQLLGAGAIGSVLRHEGYGRGGVYQRKRLRQLGFSRDTVRLLGEPR